MAKHSYQLQQPCKKTQSDINSRSSLAHWIGAICNVSLKRQLPHQLLSVLTDIILTAKKKKRMISAITARVVTALVIASTKTSAGNPACPA
jgi:hypothetical protein